MILRPTTYSTLSVLCLAFFGALWLRAPLRAEEPTSSKAPAAPSDKKAPAAPSDKKAPAAPSDKKAPAVPSDKKAPAVPSDKETEAEAERLFALKVLPVLKEKCYGCHADKPTRLKGDFDLRTREATLRGGESEEPGVVPGDPEKSLLFQAILWKDDLEMPPKENDRLSAAQIEVVRRWIAAGAPWPDEARRAEIREEAARTVETSEGLLMRTSGGPSAEWNGRRYARKDVWAFLPVREVDPPSVDKNPIDAFIDARLQAAGVTPAPQADARTLIRRVTYDLTGLPPTAEETRAFVEVSEDDPERAWQDLVDRLLDSPHFGERQAQHWLDVVRYADTSGFSNDYERSNAWRYRDWVVRSFNEDKPYDEFVIEQIAGDELHPGDAEGLIATGFLRMGPWGTAMIPQEEARQIWLDDVVQSVGVSFLSIPMRCAKCHDHKFDPIPTRDYYRLYAAFSTTQPAEMPAAFTEDEKLGDISSERRLVERLYEIAESDRKRIVEKRETAARKWYAEHDLPYKDYEARKKDPDDKKPPRHVGLDHVDEGTLKVREQDAWIWKRRRERFEPLAQSVYNGPDLAVNARKLRKPAEIDASWRPESTVYIGGARVAKGEPVTPGVLSGPVLDASGLAGGTERETEGEEDPWAVTADLSGRRLALARWIADPRNPLSTRSIVNRLWQHHFGRGIVATPNNLGAKGGKPTHPDLLDWLARELVSGGWKLKRLHRSILHSKAYRRAGRHPQHEKLLASDPNNELLAWYSPRLLTAEEIRDSLLSVTGELERRVGGLPIRPEINREVALEPRMIQFSIAPAHQPSRTPAERNRRSIYAYRVRGQADPFLEILNQPGPNDSCAVREGSAVTPQAFTLLNSDLMMDRAIALALRLEREHESRAARIEGAFQMVLGRAPRAAEEQRLAAYVEEMETYHEANPPKEIEYSTEVTRSLVEEFSGKPFEYIEQLPVFEDWIPDAKPWTVGASTRALADVSLLLFNTNEFVYVY